ncbi:hypothetical protein As57867_019182, partial [Aphanomyces stellatus]
MVAIETQTSPFVTLLGPTLLQKEPLPKDASHLIPDKATYRWKGVSCDGCSETIVGRRFTCKDDNFDLCHACLKDGFKLHPAHILAPVPIPDLPPRATVASVATDHALAGKYVLLYFSADWCGFCGPFLDLLIPYYHGMQARSGVDFEVVFVSSDHDEDSF